MADVQRNGLSEEALERIKFSFSSKNAENVVAPCLVDVYMAEDPRDDKNASLSWQLVTTGVVALLRNRESTKKGWIWNISVAIADRFHGMCVWRDRLSKESSYSVMSDTFHVFSVNDIQAITAFVFESPQHGRHFGETYKQWVRDKLRDDGFKGKIQSGPRFRRDMISRPCNFQHISGSAALAQIQQMEDAKQAVGKVISTIGRRRAISLDNIDGDFGGGGGGKRHKKKDHLRNDWPSRFEHMNIPLPNKQQSTSGGLDLMYSQEPGTVQDNTAATVTMEARVVEQQQPIHSNGVSHAHHVPSSSSIPQYHQQQYAHHQNGGQQIDYTQQQYFEEEEDQYHRDNLHNHQHSYQQDQGGYHNYHQQDQGGYQNHQQDQGGYHNHHQQDQSYYQNQPDAQEMKYEIEDIGYDYDDDMLNEPTEHYWRESIMEGTNWEDEIMKAWKLHGGATGTTASSEYS